MTEIDNFSSEQFAKNATRKNGEIFLNGGHSPTGEPITLHFDKLSTNPENLASSFESLEQQLKTEVLRAKQPVDLVRLYYEKDQKMTPEKAKGKLNDAAVEIANAMIQKESTESYLNLPEVQQQISSESSLSPEVSKDLGLLRDYLQVFDKEIGALIIELHRLTTLIKKRKLTNLA